MFTHSISLTNSNCSSCTRKHQNVVRMTSIKLNASSVEQLMPLGLISNTLNLQSVLMILMTEFDLELRELRSTSLLHLKISAAPLLTK
jgi:hypothetical protein